MNKKEIQQLIETPFMGNCPVCQSEHLDFDFGINDESFHTCENCKTVITTVTEYIIKNVEAGE